MNWYKVNRNTPKILIVRVGRFAEHLFGENRIPSLVVMVTLLVMPQTAMAYLDPGTGSIASSCENMPNILLETMASGLPIACSNLGPMPEVLGDAGVYFDPEQPEEIARALCELIESPQLRTKLVQASYQRAQQFSWQRCADETFRFLVAVTHRQKGTD